MLSKVLSILAIPFFRAFGLFGGFIFYFLFFSLLSFVYSVPVFFIIKIKKIPISKQFLFFPIYGYAIAFILFAFSITVQSAASFFWELVFICSLGFVHTYLRVILACKFDLDRQKKIAIISFIIFLVLVLVICFGMPLFPD